MSAYYGTYSEWKDRRSTAEYKDLAYNYMAFQVAEILEEHGLPLAEDLVKINSADPDFVFQVYGEQGTTAFSVLHNAVILLKSGARSIEEAVQVLLEIATRFYRDHPTLGYDYYRPPIDGKPGREAWYGLVADLEDYFERYTEHVAKRSA